MENINNNYNVSEVDELLTGIGDFDIDSLLSEVTDLKMNTISSTQDNSGLVSTAEINKFLFELEADTSILRKRPGDVTGEKEFFQLKVLEEIYVLPLLELANRINMKINGCRVEFFGLEGLSITGKSMKIRDFLLTKGCTKKVFMQVIPKEETEINVLLAARSQGFNLGFQDNQTLDNNDRVSRARQFLESISLGSSNNEISNRYK